MRLVRIPITMNFVMTLSDVIGNQKVKHKGRYKDKEDLLKSKIVSNIDLTW